MESFKRNWTYYLAALLFALGLLLWSKGHAFENPHCLMDIQSFYCRIKVSDISKQINREDYLVKMKHHRQEGERCYQEAKDRCWYLPNIDTRKQAQHCIIQAGILAVPADPRSKIIAAIVNSLVQYGIECCEEWEYINNKFYWAQYHYEMAEFYEHILMHI